MKRRKFIKGLCKACAVATVVPLALANNSPGIGGESFTVTLKEEWFPTHPMIRQVLKWDDNETIVMWKWNELFDGKFDPTMFRHLGDNVWGRIYYPPELSRSKPKYNRTYRLLK